MKKTLIVLIFSLLIFSAYGQPLTLCLHTADKTKADKYNALASYLVNTLKEYGYDGYNIIDDRSGSPKDIADTMKNKRPDIFITSFYPASIAADNGYFPAFTAKINSSLYSGAVFFVRKDSKIFRIKDMGGKNIALGRQYSSEGHILPLMALRENGLVPVMMTTADNKKISEKSVRYFFTENLTQTASDVFLKKADVGYAESVLFENELPAIFNNSYRIIFKSDDLPSMFIMLPQNMDKPLQNKIISLIDSAINNIKGKKAMNYSGISSVYAVSFDWKALFSIIQLRDINLR